MEVKIDGFDDLEIWLREWFLFPIKQSRGSVRDSTLKAIRDEKTRRKLGGKSN